MASTNAMPGPRLIIPPKCAKCQAVWCPSCALYWQSGESMMRLCSVRLRSLRGVKSFGSGFLLGCGLEAVPEGGSWAGVK